MAPSFTTGSDHRILQAKIHIIVTDEKKVLDTLSRRKRPKENGEKELLQQVAERRRRFIMDKITSASVREKSGSAQPSRMELDGLQRSEETA